MRLKKAGICPYKPIIWIFKEEKEKWDCNNQTITIPFIFVENKIFFSTLGVSAIPSLMQDFNVAYTTSIFQRRVLLITCAQKWGVINNSRLITLPKWGYQRVVLITWGIYQPFGIREKRSSCGLGIRLAKCLLAPFIYK